ncbi:MAG: hypothetical protein A2428_05195 [Bdellovibrionales bacterium RIFOXYC1_FULL_54_43]|nr:MAG: hypothetical protein A2428_05195 [Bdellovibrionales bacterium RIFOXYC1_FULL_54_43]OFZ78975.1 MAG: hypothetical protein A2603_10230 [Bdellovibrionales bacterium RIFOXYD1_FULL_55_31]
MFLWGVKLNLMNVPKDAIRIQNFYFSFESGPLFSGLNLEISRAARVLLVGANGVGKSTLLRILAGLHMVPPESVRIFGSSPFHQMEASQETRWIGGELGLSLDIKVRELFTPAPSGTEFARRESDLLELLGISKDWRMHQVSEGQRRRVQLFLGLRRPAKVLLLDEVTAHLDVNTRSDLLEWLRRESRDHQVTILYATHIFDGLDARGGRELWPTQLVWLGFQGAHRSVSESELGHQASSVGSLGVLCENWIRGSQRRYPEA